MADDITLDEDKVPAVTTENVDKIIEWLEVKSAYEDFLYWNNEKSPIAELISWGDWTTKNPFMLKRQEVNDYINHEREIITFLYGAYDKKEQRLCDYQWKDVDEIDITYMEGNKEKKKTVCFYLTEVFG